MPDLTARFSVVDQMSSQIDSIAQAGLSMVEQFERAGDVASNALDGISDGAGGAVSAVDGVASSIAEVATQTGHWTTAAENYDKSAMEAIYTTEELVEMGMKSAEALQEQENMMTLCERSATSLSKSLETATEAQSELGAVMDEAAELTAELSKNEDVSAETKAALAKAAIDAAEAMNELSAAQQEAEDAMAACDELMASGTNDLETLEAAAERAGHASEALAEANRRASDATDELSKATEKASEEAEEGGKKGIDAINGIASAFAAAGITAILKEIAQSVYDLVDAFSEAESTVVKATGASGAALDDLTQSMMNAYAASKSGSLDDTAGAIGEINTRMGLTGEELTTVTGQFLDFANITGTNVVSSVQNVTKIMNKWGIEGSNVESVLDQLAYAGQISGISVDMLSSTLITGAASFQEMGLSLDNAISMLAQFELYGMSGTTAITAMRTAVKNFSDDGLDASIALQDVINEIANMESAADATALAVETFGSRAGVDMANAIRSGAVTVDMLTGSLEEADGTLEKTAATAQTLNQKWTQASNNISSAFTRAIQPTLDKISSGLAEVMNGIGDFLNKNPAVAKAITALGVGIGAVTVGITGFAFVTKIAIPAVVSFGTALKTALGPIGLVSVAITGLVAVGTTLAALFSSTTDSLEEMTPVTRKQIEELDALKVEYETFCKNGEETSYQAQELSWRIDELSDAISNNRKSLQEYAEEHDKVLQEYYDMAAQHEEETQKLSIQTDCIMQLAYRLDELSRKTALTAGEKQEMLTIVEKLNDEIPDLSLSYDMVTNHISMTTDAIMALAEAEYAARQQSTYHDQLIEKMEKRTELNAELTNSLEQQRAAQEELARAQEEYDKWVEEHNYDPRSPGKQHLASQAGSWAMKIDKLEENVEYFDNKVLEVQNAIAENEAEIENTANAIADIYENVPPEAEAVASAYENVREEIESLCSAYDEAYHSALESFEGQFGLFDEAQADMDATVANAQAALDSQLAYWETYSANINVLKNTSAEDLGITQENYDILMSYVQDGSAEAAGLAQSMVENINSGNLDAVAALANTAGEIQTTQEELADTTAEWQTDFTEKMLGYQEDMLGIIQDMDMSEEARASAEATINSYAEEILSGKDDAVAAAKEVSDAVSAALSTNLNVSVSTTASVSANEKGTLNAESIFLAGENGPELVARPTAAYATGTTNSADFFIAGENGPELIVGEQGSTVFPTQETDRLIDALNTRRQPMQVFVGGSGESGRDGTGGRAAEQVKRILLEIAGSGAIEVNGNAGVDRSTVLEILTEHLKPVLMQIIQSEIYEEGELAYEY